MRSSSYSPIDDIAYLARSDHRVSTLVALTVRPRTRSELRGTVGVSPSTMRRTLREFEERDWIRRPDHEYEATQLGAYIASGMTALKERVELEQRLRDVWQWLPGEESGFTVEMCPDAVVTVAEADNPYAPINRFLTLLDESDTLRFIGSSLVLLEPCRDEFCEHVIDGLQAEIIDPPRVAEYIRSTYPALSSETLASGNLTVRLLEDLPPYGVGLFDDRIAVCGHDPDSVTVRVLLDTADEEAREWAESEYDFYRRQTQTAHFGPVPD
ncbi:helix-turn-helix transcriptional regulator [Salinirubrum litoreum]|uniref:Helix-turn-helix transcriptional regulator n=1 Tax=Salinirubrum litoreum TaxID=1126234 RepID=A0ABD5RG65_9EURY|nr:MarR family transcriptional regulator [Salinirubrum litoreum]